MDTEHTSFCHRKNLVKFRQYNCQAFYLYENKKKLNSVNTYNNIALNFITITKCKRKTLFAV